MTVHLCDFCAAAMPPDKRDVIILRDAVIDVCSDCADMLQRAAQEHDLRKQKAKEVSA